MSVLEFAFPAMSGKQIDSIAYSLIRKMQPDVLLGKSPFDIERFVDVHLEDMTGIAPDYRSDLPSEIYGFTDTAENKLVINAGLLDDEWGDNERFYRSTVAHEVGHCLLHVPLLRQCKKDRIFAEGKKKDKVALYRKTPIPLYRNPEWQAWRFAGALLMPEEVVKWLVSQGASLREIARYFKVNEVFVETRMKALKIQI
jgi:Zn-dependent peptidase ImmA (M78 family)